MAYLLFPGRHLLNTRFQEEYLFSVLKRPLAELPILGEKRPGEPLTEVIFAITSSNQQHSRYNPIPFHLRAIGVDRFARRVSEALGVGFWIVGVPHVGQIDDFPEFIVKEIREQTEGELKLDASNTVVLCSTPGLIPEYQQAGFGVLSCELEPETSRFVAEVPIELVKRIPQAKTDWNEDALLRAKLSPASYSLFTDFPEIPKRIARLYRDPLLNDEGSLTDTRDYATYARQMDSIIALKYAEIAPGIAPGRIADEGCADGGLLVQIAKHHPDADLIGIDIAAEFLARARERQRAGEYGASFVYFHQRNLLEPIFEAGSIDTTICNSTLHEIWSYGSGEESLKAYLGHKAAQTRSGGRLVIRDVVGFPEKDEPIFMVCAEDDGTDEDVFLEFATGRELQKHLDGLSTRSRFVRFAEDFLADLRSARRRGPETKIAYEEAVVDGRRGFRLRFGDAYEFLSKKDYTDNWASEMNEQFAFWSFDEWKTALAEAGFRVLEDPNAPERGSRAYRSEWRVENHFRGKVEFFRETPGGLVPVAYPVTNMILIGEKP